MEFADSSHRLQRPVASSLHPHKPCFNPFFGNVRRVCDSQYWQELVSVSPLFLASYFYVSFTDVNVKGVSGEIVNILGCGNMGHSEKISSYKHVSNFQCVWRYSCLNVTHKTPYKRYEGKTNDVLIAFIGCVNDLNKLQHFKVSVQKSHHQPQCTFQLS